MRGHRFRALYVVAWILSPRSPWVGVSVGFSERLRILSPQSVRRYLIRVVIRILSPRNLCGVVGVVLSVRRRESLSLAVCVGASSPRFPRDGLVNFPSLYV